MRLAVLGLGSAGTRHAGNLVALGHEVVGFDPGDAPTPPGVQRLATGDEAIAAADAVIVASPNALHADQAVAALDAGRPTLVEKPLATTEAEAERIVAAAAGARMPCGVAMNLRFHPGVAGLKALLDAERLGTPYLAQASMGYALPLWRPHTDYRDGFSGKAALGGGIVWESIHELDYLGWLLGPVVRVTGDTARVSDLEIDTEDVAAAVLRFASGALAAVDLNFVEPAYRRGCVLVGARATARWDWNAGTIVIAGEGGDGETLDVSGDVGATYVAVVEDFLASLEGAGPPRTPVQDGLAAGRVAAALHASAAQERAVAVP